MITFNKFYKKIINKMLIMTHNLDFNKEKVQILNF
jgi:hypothetical protein